MNIESLPQAIPGRPRKTKLALLNFLIAFLDAQSRQVRVVQVGANDGQMEDPIWRYWSKETWTGVLIEPHPVYFSNLKKRHDDNPNITLVNSAVSSTSGTMTLFHMREGMKASFPEWLRGCASLEKERMVSAVQSANVKFDGELADSVIDETEVEVRRLDEILTSLGVETADLLLVDVEGHELEVLNSFDFTALGAKIAIIECNSGDRAVRDEISARLNEAGLLTYFVAGEIVAIRPNCISVPIEAMFHFQNVAPLTAQRQQTSAK